MHHDAVCRSDRETRELGDLEDEPQQQVLRPEGTVLGVSSCGLEHPARLGAQPRDLVVALGRQVSETEDRLPHTGTGHAEGAQHTRGGRVVGERQQREGDLPLPDDRTCGVGQCTLEGRPRVLRQRHLAGRGGLALADELHDAPARIGRVAEQLDELVIDA